ncbi:bifunctional 4-hydroxy-2-oxoglutarate aldolase/2-dehydro-3-deoxy-phosphogluconate aldolase [Weissella sagaensis]|uniref:Bifunctional 4-hydroxy-2-oxoglutarate aldolase/2-dehydro-3-deoxy-phosphogluconate aldolase n=1 Tax=Weissella sagaensis TaxID=2559928 RepID=A0ABW1RVB3_9LACO|nr:bifunctional 4-hydroxy-2-oxoglutarate aldolase/2-dehydro-3-deoxy-phosphogluconate aldolase [Weissella sagaensis]QDJ59360.1 2-dehydro-3-deoxyphosphogluconate aldolase [Weissella hellenica]QEA56671.1 bifunctional 4-hydroxy-2-oxoglutarate aldolase/2-dehydro-3-deoxy-phosphogluconate aldolase [Weissella hellenica]UEG67483.1 bifunctional 4-hydroxy-2-oxoglutarate aldolase/2-dehydro-3-deoxy-phosphogluconate aldolase [Weissella hellenica]
MNIENYPKLTVIMRGYSYEQAMLIIKLLSRYEGKVGVEVTTNNPDHLKVIADGNKQYGDSVNIGVGTVTTANQAQEAIAAGAKFMLGPQAFSEDIYRLAQQNDVITVPGAMTPTEIQTEVNKGADIVKVFPAITVGPVFFKQISGPMPGLRLMAVGGVDIKNSQSFMSAGAEYLGIGSSFFNKQDLENMDEQALDNSIQEFLLAVSK